MAGLLYLLATLAVSAIIAPIGVRGQNASTFFGATGQYDIRSCVDPKHALLSFDDGPSPNSLELLSILKSKQAPATFCYVGRDGLQYFGAAAVEAFKANHTIASHTWGHIDMPAYSDAALVKDLKDNDDLIVSRIGVAPAWVRPPFGDVDQRTLNTIHGYGAKVLVWTFDSMDSNGMNGTQLTDFMLNRAKSEIPDAANSFQGPIILFHETKLESVKLIAQYIDIIRAKGYQIVDLAKCAGINADQVYKPRSTVPPSPPPPAPGPSPPPSPPSPPSPAASSSTTRAASTATTGAVFATASTSSTKAAGAAKIHGAELGFWIIVLAAILLAF